MDKVLNLYKKKSETPLQTIERFVAAHPEYKGEKMTYAGRLDPMAEGVLVVLAGEKNKERATYTGLDKDYEFEFVLGIETDTHDVLGKITKTGRASDISETEVKKALCKYQGVFKQKYPAYSSKVVGGFPLFDLARRGKLAEVIMPEHEVEVRRIELAGSREVSKEEFKKNVARDISALIGDFRQKEILKIWDSYIDKEAPEKFTIYKVRVTSGSGFYVRQLVADIGKDLGTGAVTVSILRTRVGEYIIENFTPREL